MNKSARAADTPVFSPPAMGWLPTKRPPARAISGSNSSTTLPFTLPTSVTTAPFFNDGSSFSVNSRIWLNGVQSTTRSASLHGRLQIMRGAVHHAQFLAFRHAGRAPDITLHPVREAALLDGQPQRAAQQPDAGQGYFLPVHLLV